MGEARKFGLHPWRVSIDVIGRRRRPPALSSRSYGNVVDKTRLPEPNRAQDAAGTVQASERPESLGVRDIEIVDAREARAPQARETGRGHRPHVLARLEPPRNLPER